MQTSSRTLPAPAPFSAAPPTPAATVSPMTSGGGGVTPTVSTSSEGGRAGTPQSVEARRRTSHIRAVVLGFEADRVALGAQRTVGAGAGCPRWTLLSVGHATRRTHLRE